MTIRNGIITKVSEPLSYWLITPSAAYPVSRVAALMCDGTEFVPWSMLTDDERKLINLDEARVSLR